MYLFRASVNMSIFKMVICRRLDEFTVVTIVLLLHRDKFINGVFSIERFGLFTVGRFNEDLTSVSTFSLPDMPTWLETGHMHLIWTVNWVAIVWAGLVKQEKEVC
jgi:hypothetical protein